MEYPVRINKYLAFQNIASRREADELIRKGKVKINGRVAKLGDKVAENDKVTFENPKKFVYYAFNKPEGIITHSPQKGEKDIASITKFPEKVFPLGRLDKRSRGLIILTNDGRVTDKLLNPDYEHEKEYVVRVNKEITESFINKMGKGVMLDDGYKTKPAKVKLTGPESFAIILTEGKKRQIRRMCTALGFAVRDLLRVRVMNVKLGNLKPAHYRRFSSEEAENFRRSIGL